MRAGACVESLNTDMDDGNAVTARSTTTTPTSPQTTKACFAAGQHRAAPPLSMRQRRASRA